MVDGAGTAPVAPNDGPPLRTLFSLLKIFKTVSEIHFSVGSSVAPTDYCLGYILHSLTYLDEEVSRVKIFG